METAEPTFEVADGLQPEERPLVFIAYGREDRGAADRLYELLRRRDVSAWYDALIPAGGDWRDAIVENLSAARLMVILLSERALESEELKKELAVADQEGVPVLTARLEDVKPSQAFAYELARGNWFDLFEDLEACLHKLATLIEDLMNEPEQIQGRLTASPGSRGERRGGGMLPRGLLSNDWLLGAALVLTSTAGFLFYESGFSATGTLIETGVAPLTATAWVVIAVTLGSPLFFVSLLRGGLDGSELPLLVIAGVHTLLLGLLAYRVLVRIRRRFGGAQS